jgi:hypothetical protein
MDFNAIVLSALAAAIGAQWLYFKQKSDNCDKDRQVLWRVVARLSGIAHSTRGCPMVNCALRDQAYEALSDTEADLEPAEAKARAMMNTGVVDPNVHKAYSAINPEPSL